MLQVNVRVPMPVSHYFVYENVVRLVNDMVREKNIRLVEFENLYMIQYEEFIHANKRLLVLHDVESIRNKRAIDQQRLGIVDYGKARVQLGLLRGLERSLSQRCDWCVTVSDKERHIVEKWNPGLSVTTVPNAVDTSYFHPFEAEESNPVIVFSGTMRYLPNEIAATYLVREVLPLVQKVYPATKLVLLGKSPSENLKDLAAENPSVSVTDLVPDVRPYMSRNRIFVCPLWIGAGTRIKILEAMAMGMPVVTTRIGCEGLNVRDGASILLAENASEFAGKIELLISKPGEAERIGENGRRIAQECSWERSAEKQREVYEALLG
jgi:glycosyltransferase involved in cell wall biosynthesis